MSHRTVSHSAEDILCSGSRLPSKGVLALTLFGILVALPAGNTVAGMIKIFSFQADYKNGDAKAVDYALAIPFFTDKNIITKSTDGVKPGDPVTRGSIFNQVSVRNEGPRGANGVTLFFTSSTGATIDKNGADKFQVVISTNQKKIPIPKGTSTFRKKTGAGNIPAGDDVALVGFNVRNDPQYSINNDFFPEDMYDFTIGSLEFLNNVETVEDTTQFLDFGNSYGFDSPRPDVNVAATDLESIPFDLPMPDSGHWDFARFKLFVDDVQVGVMVQGFKNVPETMSQTTSLGLLVSSIMGLALLRTRRSKSI